LPFLLMERFHFHFDSSPLMLTLSLSYCVVHFLINSYILYQAAFTVRLQNMEIQKQRMEIMGKSEELKMLNDSLQNMNADLEVKVQNRTREIEVKNKKLEEYTFINAHHLRAPVATILGLIQLFDYKEAIETQEVIDSLKKAAVDLDQAIKSIRAKLEAEEDSLK
ncbi:MAG: hypothetical protein L0Y35_05365, partial [Flammeovirgaceae bacterium]|nr:hypothetical protein [Flammeovirgaceae bacterium]